MSFQSRTGMYVFLVALAAACLFAEEPAKPRSGLSIVHPPSIFGATDARVTIDGDARTQKVGEEVLDFQIQPGTYSLYSIESAIPVSVLKIKKGQTLYLIDRKSPGGQKQMGHIQYKAGNMSSAYAHYKASFRLDSTQTDIYKKLGELAVEFEKTSDALAALQRIERAGIADASTYRQMGDVYRNANRPAQAARMYERALKEGGETPELLFGLGKVKLASGDYTGAVRAHRRAVELQPDSSVHYRALGDAYLAQGDSAAAIQQYERFLSNGGKSSRVALQVGTFYFDRRRFEDAAAYLSGVQGKMSQSLECLMMLGESMYNLGEYNQAWPPLRTAANRYTRSDQWPRITETLIKSYIAIGERRKAEYWVKKFAKVSKRRSPDVAFYRAYLLEKSSPSKARSHYEKNTRSFSSDHRNFLRLGLLLSKDRKTLSSSLANLRKAVSLADTIPQAWLEIARVYRHLGKKDDELRALQVYLASDPQNPEATARVGELMLSSGKTKEALEKLEKANRDTDDPQVLQALARGYAMSGQYGKAISALEKAKTLAPNDITVGKRLVDLYRRNGDTRNTLGELKRLLGIRRDNPTLFLYAKLSHQAGKYNQAHDAIENIRATDPTHIPSLMLLGEVLRAQGKHEDAVEIYEEITFIDDENVDALYERAETHLEKGQVHWAETFYKRTLKKQSDHALSVLGLAKVARLRKDMSGYRAYLSRARRLDPENEEIRVEFVSGNK